MSTGRRDALADRTVCRYSNTRQDWTPQTVGRVIEFMASNVHQGTYDADSLADALIELQRHFGLSSSEFYRAYRADDPSIAAIPRLVRFQWADYFSEWLELTDSSADDAPHESVL